MALAELADRCEQATGPDATLDIEIHDVITPGPGRYICYTASLDAAMTLVPEDQGAAVTIREATAQAFRAVDTEAEFRKRLPLFVCAAALRARSA